MTFCGKCGARNPDDSRFCWQCGAKLLVTQIAEEPAPVVEESVAPGPEPVREVPERDNSEERRSWEAYRAGYEAARHENTRTADDVWKRSDDVGDSRTSGQGVKVSQDPELKDGFTRIDDRTIGFGGKRYSIDPQDISNYKVGAAIVIVITYIVSLYLVFGYEFQYDLEITEVGFTLYDICTGDNTFDGPVPFLFWLGLILLVCGFIPTCSMGGAVLMMIVFTMVQVFASNVDLAIIEIGVPLRMVPESIIPGVVMVFVIMILVCISSWLMSKATMPATMMRNVGYFGALASFYTGRRY